jgi:Histidine kinase
MVVNPLVFSNKPRYRIGRHFLFWACWLLYDTVFTAMSFQPMLSFWAAFPGVLLEQVVEIPLDMAFCYSIIYFLIPSYLRKGKYVEMVFLWLFFSVLFVACFRFYMQNIVPFLRRFNGLPQDHHNVGFVWVFFALFSQINMEGCIAASIKLGKMWFVKEQELDLVKKEKMKIEPHLQEGRMQPVFLLHALERVTQLSEGKPGLVPDMIGRIKRLLLYVIYENNQASIGLGKELQLLNEYVELEKAGLAESLHVAVRITGNPTGERIAPFIILPLVENGFRQLSALDMPKKSMNLDIAVTEGSLHMKLEWSKPTDSSTLVNGNHTSLQHIGKRLDLLYPQSHALKVVITSDHFIIDLKIELHRAIN